MANGKGRTESWMQLAKRNTVVAAIVLFVCVAVYLNWNYQKEQDADTGKTLGDAALVDGDTNDPLLGGQKSTGSAPGDQEDQNGFVQDQEPSAASSYFANARLNRQQARDSALSLLQEAGSGEDADPAVKEQVGAAIQTMADYTVTEAQIENLVVAKGYADCMAFISDSGVSVVVEMPEGELTGEDTAKIMDIVAEATSFPATQIKIIGV